MAGRHGTRRRYNEGCRCDDCRAANTSYAQRYRQRPTALVPLSAPPVTPQPLEPGPVESGVQAEISDLAAGVRPGLAQAALALARILDNPRAVNQQPAAAKVTGGAAGQAGFGVGAWSSRRSRVGADDDGQSLRLRPRKRCLVAPVKRRGPGPGWWSAQVVGEDRRAQARGGLAQPLYGAETEPHHGWSRIAGARKPVAHHVAGGRLDGGGAGVAGERGGRAEAPSITDVAEDLAGPALRRDCRVLAGPAAAR
jgi:hypothetical protein